MLTFDMVMFRVRCWTNLEVEWDSKYKVLQDEDIYF
jgi:hypothetical protein